jgi:hypothetical protein
MDRDLGKPGKSQTSTGKWAGSTIVPAGLAMKQIRHARIRNACIRRRLHSTSLPGAHGSNRGFGQSA